MANPLFNMLAGRVSNSPIGNIISQYQQLQKDPGKIVDILYQNGKINQQQFNDLQPIRNNPEQIVTYLSRNGNNNLLNQATQLANQINNFK